MSNRWASRKASIVDGYYRLVGRLPPEQWMEWNFKRATEENYFALREIVFPGIELPERLRSDYRRGLLTMDEAKRLWAEDIQAARDAEWQKIVDCTCQPALPDGRESVCSECENHNNRIAEIEF